MTRLCGLLFCGLVLSLTAFAGMPPDPSDALRDKFNAAGQAEGAAAANALAALLAECNGVAGTLMAPKTNVQQTMIQNWQRRNVHVLMNDIQDHIGKLSAAEAQTGFANLVSKVPPIVAECIMMGQRAAPANETLDAAALKLIKSGTPFKVRVAAMDLLAAHKYAPAVDVIITQLVDKENPAVQITACRALSKIPDKKSIPALIKYLAGNKGRYQYEACAALRILTGQKLKADPAQWNEWWSKAEATFDIAAAKADPKAYNFELTENSDQMYYEIPVVENRMVFVFDVSGSMKYGGNPDRFEKARGELKEFIKRLRPTQTFNIIPFSTTVSRYQNTPMVPANDLNKKSALQFIDLLKAEGGTQTTTALEDAFNFVAAAYGCETIFLVTDGYPNPWVGIEPDVDKQVRHINWMNQCLKVRINCVGIYTRVPSDDTLIPNAPPEKPKEMKRFLEELSKDNDGAYKEIP